MDYRTLTDSTHIRIDVEGLVLNQCLGHVHHLSKDKHILETVSDFLGDKLHKVWHELVQAWVLPKTGISRGTVVLAGLIKERAANLLKVELEFAGEDVFDERLHSDISRSTHSGQCRVGVGSLGDQLEVARIGGSRVLGDGWLNAFHC